jgi:hypothetical protein
MNGPAGFAIVVLALAYASSGHAAPPPASGLQGAAPVYREIKDWVLACDNTRVCFAKYGAADAGAGGGGYLSIARDAGPAGALVVSLEEDEDGAVPDPHSLRLDGQPLAGGAAWTADAKDQTATLSGDAALAFVRSIAGGKALGYSNGKATPTVSLSGMTAVLLAMDEDQGRLDGRTALARPGPKPADAVPAALPVPIVHGTPPTDAFAGGAAFAAQVRRTQVALLAKHECETDVLTADHADALNDREALVTLGCVRGAYQTSVLVFRAPRDAPQKASQVILPLQPTLTDADSPPQDRGEYVAEDGWDPKTATFVESAKGRGMADCGQSTEWLFDGAQFHVASFNRLDRCGGGPPGDWPTLYRTTEVLTK